MNQKLIRFIESINDDKIMEFMVGNLSSDGLFYLFEILQYADIETKTKWDSVYEIQIEKALTMKGKRGTK